ncbi:NAD(P)/FAD-dependent oxidoreductase [Vibrio sp. V39_P1S14PM300]|uniref:NAD(P)/FAD-dependent oxidoreductase n=1 Tax=Vibrio sp. V39_P1S14PM300 TaxID=1938690 RepID=UPI0013732CF2|nr:FAD-binding oxidoreductase [Vibrio sp. V39_P1S14PM300]NAX23587.1 FAD-dependent oxidoreductase [Vibrio sp. V39_P1S14PM300]
MRVKHTNSYYAASKNQSFEFPELQGEHTADVCVIGSGITGTTAALELANRGFKVIVLEANRVGWGASGRSGGQAIFGWAADQHKLEKMVGFSDAKKLWDISVEALALTKENIRKYNIDCDWRDGMAHLAMKPRQDQELQEWHDDLHQRYGYESLKMWDKQQVRDNIASDKYTSGLFDSNSGHLHPLNYTLGLVRAAGEAGALFYEASKVHKIEHGETATLYTQAGTVKAKHVILACNAYMEGLESSLENKVMPVGTYICATEPLGEEATAALMKNHIAACDINFVLDYYRCSGDYRMLFGGRVSYSGMEPLNLEKAMRARMLDIFPQLDHAKIDFAWGGNVAITMNRAPHFGRLKPNVYFAQGFSGHGIAATGMAGTLMAECVATTAERFAIFDKIPHLPFPGGRLLRTPALVLAMSYYRVRDML